METSDLSSVENWIPARDRLRNMVHDKLVGRLTLPRTPPNPRTRLVLDNDDYRGYKVVLDVAPDIIAAGILLVKEAGGVVTDMLGGDTYLASGDVVAGGPRLHETLLEVTQAKFR